jgi:hypothetical protein
MGELIDLFLPSDDGPASGSRRKRGEGARTKALRAEILSVLDEIGGSMSSRQVFYQAVSRGAVENTKKDCVRVGRLLVKMRRDGSVPYARICDRTRSRHVRPSWAGVMDIMQATASHFRLDYWARQPVVPMVAVEKQALEGIFAEACDEYGVPLYVLRGFNSESFEYEWSEDIKEITESGREVAVAYFGDWDPSGLDIERNSRDKLERFGARFTWERIGLLESDFDAFDLVKVPVKTTDSRAKVFLNTFGDCAAELDALHPDELQRRIHDAIAVHVDADTWRAVQAEEQVQRESLQEVTGNWEVALAAARAPSADQK